MSDPDVVAVTDDPTKTSATEEPVSVVEPPKPKAMAVDAEVEQQSPEYGNLVGLPTGDFDPDAPDPVSTNGRRASQTPGPGGHEEEDEDILKVDYSKDDEAEAEVEAEQGVGVGTEEDEEDIHAILAGLQAEGGEEEEEVPEHEEQDKGEEGPLDTDADIAVARQAHAVPVPDVGNDELMPEDTGNPGEIDGPPSAASSPLSDLPDLPTKPYESPKAVLVPLSLPVPAPPPAPAPASTAPKRPHSPVQPESEAESSTSAIKRAKTASSRLFAEAERNIVPGKRVRKQIQALEFDELSPLSEDDRVQRGPGRGGKKAKAGGGGRARAPAKKKADPVTGAGAGAGGEGTSNPRPKGLSDKDLLGMLKGKTRERQIASCLRGRYGGWGKCCQCVGKVAGDSCRFKDFRMFQIDPTNGAILDTARHEDTTLKEDMTPLPREFNGPWTEAEIRRTEATVAPLLLPLISRELRHIINNKAVVREVDVAKHRSVCDFCSSTIFGGYFCCQKCGRDYCLQCERYFSDSIEAMRDSPWDMPDAARPRLLRCTNAPPTKGRLAVSNSTAPAQPPTPTTNGHRAEATERELEKRLTSTTTTPPPAPNEPASATLSAAEKHAEPAPEPSIPVPAPTSNGDVAGSADTSPKPGPSAAAVPAPASRPKDDGITAPPPPPTADVAPASPPAPPAERDTPQEATVLGSAPATTTTTTTTAPGSAAAPSAAAVPARRSKSATAAIPRKQQHFHVRPDLVAVTRFHRAELEEHWNKLVAFVLDGEGGKAEDVAKCLGLAAEAEEEGEGEKKLVKEVEAYIAKYDPAKVEPKAKATANGVPQQQEDEAEDKRYYTKITHPTAPHIPDPADLRDHSHPFLFVPSPDLDNRLFDRLWAKGEPMVIDKVGEQFKQDWTPDTFIRRFGQDQCVVMDCQTEAVKGTTVGEFFQTFKDPEQRSAKGVWKLKDWPSTSDFQSAYPDLYNDFCDSLPVPDYTRREGVLNLYSHFPAGATKPDIGPKMYNAFAAKETAGGHGSTRLHMDVADAINIMLYASPRTVARATRSESAPTGEPIVDTDKGSPTGEKQNHQSPSGPNQQVKEEEQPGCAVWDLFRAEDADKIRQFLKDKYGGKVAFTDPIHSQIFYLDADLRRELADQYGVVSFRVYQYPGQAVFIPAGCAHQVCNLADCIKIALDFVSPHNVSRCQQLMHDFRKENYIKAWKDDVLQLYNVMWYSWLNAQETRERRRLEAIAEQAKIDNPTQHQDQDHPMEAHEPRPRILTTQISSVRDEPTPVSSPVPTPTPKETTPVPAPETDPREEDRSRLSTLLFQQMLTQSEPAPPAALSAEDQERLERREKARLQQQIQQQRESDPAHMGIKASDLIKGGLFSADVALEAIGRQLKTDNPILGDDGGAGSNGDGGHVDFSLGAL